MQRDKSSRMEEGSRCRHANRSAKPLLWSSMTDRVTYRPRTRHPRGPLHVDQEGRYIRPSQAHLPYSHKNREMFPHWVSDLGSISRPSPSESTLNETARTRTPNSASSSSNPASTASAATTSPLVFWHRRGDTRAPPPARWWHRQAAWRREGS
jgi:hypothetical protein